MADQDQFDLLREKNAAKMAAVRAAKQVKRSVSPVQPVPDGEGDEPQRMDVTEDIEEPPVKPIMELPEKTFDPMDVPPVTPNICDNDTKNTTLPLLYKVAISAILTGSIYFLGKYIITRAIDRYHPNAEHFDPVTKEMYIPAERDRDPFINIKEPTPQVIKEVKPEEAFKGSDFSLPIILSKE